MEKFWAQQTCTLIKIAQQQATVLPWQKSNNKMHVHTHTHTHRHTHTHTPYSDAKRTFNHHFCVCNIRH